MLVYQHAKNKRDFSGGLENIREGEGGTKKPRLNRVNPSAGRVLHKGAWVGHSYVLLLGIPDHKKFKFPW